MGRRELFCGVVVVSFLLIAACSGGSGGSGGVADGGGGNGGGTSGAPGSSSGDADRGRLPSTRFVEQAADLTASDDWDGSPIRIAIAGVAMTLNGGVKIVASSATTRIAAKARILALADDKATADSAIVEAKATFQIRRESGATVIACGNGGSHGTTTPEFSGCELVEIAIPAGTLSRKLDLDVTSGNGETNLDLGAASVARLVLKTTGPRIVAQLSSTVGGRVDLVGERAADIEAKLLTGWAADEVLLEADPGLVDNRVADAKLGVGAGGRGPAGTGLASLKLTSRSFAGSSGRIRLE